MSVTQRSNVWGQNMRHPARSFPETPAHLQRLNPALPQSHSRGRSDRSFHPPTHHLLPHTRPGVGTRNSVGHANDVDTQFDALMQSKNSHRRAGNLDEANRIQAAVNVGVTLGWNKKDVLDVVSRLEKLISPPDDEDGEEMLLDDRMMELAGEEEVLGFLTGVRKAEKTRLARDGGTSKVDGQDTGFERLRLLRKEFGPKGGAEETRLETRARKMQRTEVRERELSLHAPLLLIKIQAALNVAMAAVLASTGSAQKVSSNAKGETGNNSKIVHDPNIVECFDFPIFMLKATHLLRVPNGNCGKEIDYYLRASRVGRIKFQAAGTGARQVVAYPGIDRPLKQAEKTKILWAFSTTTPKHAEILEVLLRMLGSGHEIRFLKAGLDRTTEAGDLLRLVAVELSDEGFLVLEFLNRRHGEEAVLAPDYVTRRHASTVRSVNDSPASLAEDNDILEVSGDVDKHGKQDTKPKPRRRSLVLKLKFSKSEAGG